MKPTALIIMLVLAIYLAACSPASSTEPAADPVTATNIPSLTPSFTSTTALTSTVTVTPLPPSPTVTLTRTPRPPTPTKTQISTAVPTEYHAYIGKAQSSMAENIEERGGMLIEDYYLLDLLQDGNRYLLSFSYLKIVTDILVLPPLGPYDTISTGGCLLNGVNDPWVIAVHSEDEETLSARYVTQEKIRKAWRVNLATHSFEEISTNGIECFTEEGFDPNNVIYKLMKELGWSEGE